MADVENSWQRFVDETLLVLPVRSWTLVTPWNPTHERLEWLQRLTGHSGLRTAATVPKSKQVTRPLLAI